MEQLLMMSTWVSDPLYRLVVQRTSWTSLQIDPQSRLPVTSATRRETPMSCHCGGTSTTIVVKSTSVIAPQR